MKRPIEGFSKIFRVRAIATNAALLFFTLFLVIGFLSLEVHESIRAAVWPNGSFAYDPDAGYAFSPSAPFPTRISGQYSVRIHPLGFRIPLGVPADSPEPGGILGVGSSNTFGVNVECEQTFLARLGAKLGRPSYNYGVPSYAYPNMLQKLRGLVQQGILARLHPSVVTVDLGTLLESNSLMPIRQGVTPYAGVPYIARANRRKGESSLEVVHEPDSISIRHYFELLDRYRITPGKPPGLTWDRLKALLRFSPQILLARAVGIEPRLLNLASGETQVENPDDPAVILALYRYFFHELERIFPDPNIQILAVWMPFHEGEQMSPQVAEAARESRVRVINGSSLVQEGNRIHPGPAVHELFAEALSAAIKSGVHAF